MNFHHPDRAKLPNGRPAYMSPSGKPIAALVVPQIEVELEQQAGRPVYTLYWWLLIATGIARPHTITTTEPWPIIEEFLANPEEFLKAKFNYSYEPSQVRTVRQPRPIGRPELPEISLADLGL